MIFGAVVGASARAVDSHPGGVSEVEGLWGAGCAVGGCVSLPINVHFMAGWVESSGWYQASLGVDLPDPGPLCSCVADSCPGSTIVDGKVLSLRAVLSPVSP